MRSRPLPGLKARASVCAGLPRLYVTGEEEHAPRRLLDWLKRQAHLDLKTRVAVHAKRLDLTPKRLYVRDQTTRWGSCSTSGALSFSWRLVLAPPFVLDYLAAHEVAHLGHMNHGPRFWALVERTMPRHEEARSWLRKHGGEPASLWRRGDAPVLDRHLAQAQHRVVRERSTALQGCRTRGGTAAAPSLAGVELPGSARDGIDAWRARARQRSGVLSWCA